MDYNQIILSQFLNDMICTKIHYFPLCLHTLFSTLYLNCLNLMLFAEVGLSEQSENRYSSAQINSN